MQEQDIFMAKFKSERVPTPVISNQVELDRPGPPQIVELAKKRRWSSWVRHLVVALLKAQDLDHQKYQELESKRTRQQIEQNRISRYF
jgi:hypothetical protein